MSVDQALSLLAPWDNFYVIVGVAIGLPVVPAPSLFLAAATSLLLLFVGIHNAWDAVTYVALRKSKKQEGAGTEP